MRRALALARPLQRLASPVFQATRATNPDAGQMLGLSLSTPQLTVLGVVGRAARAVLAAGAITAGEPSVAANADGADLSLFGVSIRFSDVLQ